MIARGAERVMRVSDDQVAAAMRAIFADTHNVAGGAGAAGVAALLAEREAMRGREAGVVLSRGNVGGAVFARVLAAAPKRARVFRPGASRRRA